MKKTRIFAVLGSLALALLSVVLIAADHLDAPDIAGTSSDIADFYAFQGEDPNNLVFVVDVQGLLAPDRPTEQAVFDENVLLEINIDTNNDLVEDKVIQMIKRVDPTTMEDTMYFFGPLTVQDSETGVDSTIDAENLSGSVKISTTTEVETTTSNGMMFFAGPREDPFFFDFDRYNQILSGAATGFSDPGTDSFAGTNVLSVVVEVPKVLLGSGFAGANPLAPGTPVYGVWVEAKRKQ